MKRRIPPIKWKVDIFLKNLVSYRSMRFASLKFAADTSFWLFCSSRIAEESSAILGPRDCSGPFAPTAWKSSQNQHESSPLERWREEGCKRTQWSGESLSMARIMWSIRLFASIAYSWVILQNFAENPITQRKILHGNLQHCCIARLFLSSLSPAKRFFSCKKLLVECMELFVTSRYMLFYAYSIRHTSRKSSMIRILWIWP